MSFLAVVRLLFATKGCYFHLLWAKICLWKTLPVLWQCATETFLRKNSSCQCWILGTAGSPSVRNSAPLNELLLLGPSRRWFFWAWTSEPLTFPRWAKCLMYSPLFLQTQSSLASCSAMNLLLPFLAFKQESLKEKWFLSRNPYISLCSAAYPKKDFLSPTPFVIITYSTILLIVKQIYNLGITFRLKLLLGSLHPNYA